MSKRDKAGDTAQAAKGNAKRAAGNPYAQAEDGAEKKAELKQAGEKLKGHGKR